MSNTQAARERRVREGDSGFVQCADLNMFPMEACYRDYKLTKDGSLAVRIGLDVFNFTPYVLFLGGEYSRGKRLWTRLSVEEFEEMTSDNIYNKIKNNLESETFMEPIHLGDINLEIEVLQTSFHTWANLFLRRTENKYSSIMLDESTWKMLKRALSLIGSSLSDIQSLAHDARLYFPDYINNCKNIAIEKGYPQTLPTEDDALQTIFNENTDDSFPLQLKREMICYHMDFLKEKLLSAMSSINAERSSTPTSLVSQA